MEHNEVATVSGKPQMSRLKALGTGIKVGKVLGPRVLVKTVLPFTDADRVEKEGLIKVPDWVKKENTPLPTTGIVVAVGPDVQGLQEGDMILFGKFAGVDFVIEEQDMRIIHMNEVLCTLVDTEEVVTEVLSAD